MYRIAICDDDEYFREYMKKVIVNAEGADSDLQFEFYSSGEQLLDTEKEHLLQIDLLILDMQLSGIYGRADADRDERSIKKGKGNTKRAYHRGKISEWKAIYKSEGCFIY